MKPNKHRSKKKIKIKAWAMVCKDTEGGNYISAEARPRWGRFWIFETREQARKEVKSRFWNQPRKAEKIVKIKITEV